MYRPHAVLSGVCVLMMSMQAAYADLPFLKETAGDAELPSAYGIGVDYYDVPALRQGRSVHGHGIRLAAALMLLPYAGAALAAGAASVSIAKRLHINKPWYAPSGIFIKEVYKGLKTDLTKISGRHVGLLQACRVRTAR